MVDVELLRAEIKDLGITDVKLAEKCNFTTRTLQNKLNKPNTITVNDALNIARALRIQEPEKLFSIFFASEVEKKGN